MEQDLIAFLTEAREACEDLEGKEAVRREVLEDEKLAEKQVAQEAARLDSEVESAVRRRRQAVSDRYDSEVEAINGKLRKIEAGKSEAMEAGRSERIELETQDPVNRNLELDDYVEALLKKKEAPAMCAGFWFPALVMPSRPADFLFDAAVFLVAVVLIPCGLFYILPFENVWLFALIYIADIILFGGIYLHLINLKIRYLGLLREMKKVKAARRANDAEIAAITKEIRNDDSEDPYDLDTFNSEIEECREEQNRIRRKKQAALAAFDGEEAGEIEAEVREKSGGKLRNLEEEQAAFEKERRGIDEEIRAMKAEMAENYEQYLGSDFLSAAKIDDLIEILESGQAGTLKDAIRVFRNSSF